MRIALAAVLLLVAGGAFAADKIVIMSFTGPDGAAARVQVADGLCGVATCVDPKKATKGAKPDWAKAKKEKIEFFVGGVVKGKGAKKTIEVELFTKAGPPKLKKSYPYAKLDAAIASLKDAMGLAAGAPPPEPEKKKEPEPAPEPEKKAEPETKKEPEKRKEPEAPPPPPKEEERKSEEPPPEESSSSTGAPKPPIFEAELGADLFSRSFSYNNVATMNLRSYSASFIFAPEGRIEFYPLALFTQSFLAGLGIDGSFAYAVGLKSRRSGTDVTWSTTLFHYDFDVRFRIRPVSSVDAAVIPFVGYGNRSFSVGPGSDGSTLDGLPGVSYSAVRAGLAGELPFSNFMVFAKFAALITLSSGQIISAQFFPNGSNFGIEGQVGVGYRVFGPVQIRLAFDFTRYGLGFNSAATDTYQAAGAVDMYIGGNAAVRVIF